MPQPAPPEPGSDSLVARRDDRPFVPEAQLFRHEVLAERQTHWLGTVVLEPRTAHRGFTLFAACAAAAIVGMFFFFDVTRTTRVGGWLVPEAGLARVYAPQAGVVAGLHVKEGSMVRKGDRLLTLSAEVNSTSRGATQAEVTRLLAARRKMLIDQRAQDQRLLTQQQRALGSRLAAFRAEQAQIEQEIAVQKSRLDLAQRTEARQRDLQGQGFISKQQLQQVEEARLAQAGRLISLERERTAAVRERMALESELNDLPLKAQTDISIVERDIAAVEQQLAEAEARREITITAPQDGKVTAILAEPGGHASTAAPLLTIVPAGSRLEAHLYGPSRAIGFVRPGQPVLLRYQAYPYEKFGHYGGTVASVSTAAINPGELPFAGIAPTAPGANEPVYRITVSLAQQAVTAYGQPQALQPGMELEADLALDKRRLYEWVLDPLYAIAGKAAP